MLAFVVAGKDPVLALFTWLTQLGTLAILALMALASFAVLAFFMRNPTLDTNHGARAWLRWSVALRWPPSRSTPPPSSARSPATQVAS